MIERDSSLTLDRKPVVMLSQRTDALGLTKASKHQFYTSAIFFLSCQRDRLCPKVYVINVNVK